MGFMVAIKKKILHLVLYKFSQNNTCFYFGNEIWTPLNIQIVAKFSFDVLLCHYD